MNLTVADEGRYDRTPDGAIWTQGDGSSRLWERYLEVFSRVTVLARVRDVGEIPQGFIRADGEGIFFAALPYFVGPWQYLPRAKEVKRAACRTIEKHDAVILRIPGQIGSCVEPFLRKSGHPYAVEVRGDPYDVFAPGAVIHPLRPFFRWWFPRAMRRQCAYACAAAYVTQYTLQRRYPCLALPFEVLDKTGPSAQRFHANPHVTHFSSIELPAESFIAESRVPAHLVRGFTIITIGSLAQMYKGVDTLIDAVAACIREGLDLRLVILGEGKHRPELEARAQARGLLERTRFLGHIPPGSAVVAELDNADLFVLASRTEGLPRAMIEAMARGLPCIGSAVGGIPELLCRDELVLPGQAPVLAKKIQEMLSDPERMATLSARNVEKAREFRAEILRERRIGFYRYVRAAMEEYRE